MEVFLEDLTSSSKPMDTQSYSSVQIANKSLQYLIYKYEQSTNDHQTFEKNFSYERDQNKQILKSNLRKQIIKCEGNLSKQNKTFSNWAGAGVEGREHLTTEECD